MNSELITKISSLKEKSGHFSVLYVEDEEELRIGVSAFLSKVFTCFDVAVDGQDGLDKYLKKKYDIVITDIQMPRMNGIEMISNIRKSNMNQEIIVVSAYTDSDHLTQSIKLDVTGYIIKPVNFMQILHVLEKSIYKLTAFRENELYKTRLESMVEERTKSILELKHQQAQNYKHAIHSLVKMIEARDTYTGGHSERVAIYSRDIAIAMGLDEEQCNLIYEAGILHDVGKIITPDAILLKPSKLTETEFALIKEHVTAGYKILANIPMYKHLADIVYAHHERYDGQGYPRGLKGEQIPLLSRIMTIADSFDAMTTQRIYKAKKSISNTIKELVELSGTWFDPEIIKHAVSVLSNMDVDKYIQQIPATQIDDQRFAYFYKDPLTSLYNHFYLDFLLQNNKESHVYMYLSIIYIKSFTAYNKKHGWSEGDILLGSFSNYLQNKFSALKIFRIFGDDFVLLHNEEINIKIDEINALPLLKNNNIQCGSKQYNLKEVTINGYKDLQE